MNSRRPYLLMLAFLVVGYVLQQTFGSIVGDWAIDRFSGIMGIEKARLLGTASEYVLPALVAAFFVYGAFLVGRYDRPSPLKLVYEVGPDCVRDRVNHLGNIVGTWHYIGICNASADQTLYDVSVFGLDSTFAELVLRPTHDPNDSNKREPRICWIETLHPGVTEYRQLAGLDASFRKLTNPHDRLRGIHRFVIEARARDVKAYRLELEFDPGKSPMINRI